jgi:Fe-S cluster assembly protein SufD
MSDKLSFLEQFDHIPAQFPQQGDARAAIHNGLDFPTTRDEYWKYTRVAKLVSAQYNQNGPSSVDISSLIIPDLDAHLIVFVNGVFSADHSIKSLVSGLSIQSIASLEGDDKSTALVHLGRHIDSKSNAFTALNTAYFQDGIFIKIDKNAVIEKPIYLLNVSTGEQQASQTRNLFLVGENAKVEIVNHFTGNANSGSFTNAVTEVVAEAGSNGKMYLLQEEGDESNQVNSTHIVQKASSTFSVLTVTMSGALVRNNLNFAITGEGCESNLNGLYFTSGNQHVDNHTYADHQVANCNSNELYKGVMTDKSTGVFNGKIMVHQAAQKTNAFQSNQNILLTDRATINTKPELEIYADDVKCSHGCTIGQLDEEAMFYLQSRGLGKMAATKLLLNAFASDVVEMVDNEAVKTYIEHWVEKKMNN